MNLTLPATRIADVGTWPISPGRRVNRTRVILDHPREKCLHRSSRKLRPCTPDSILPLITPEGGETSAVLALLEDVDVRGSVFTLDALHTIRNTALAIRRHHDAHYLFTVQDNAPETFQTLEIIDWDRDATARFSEIVLAQRTDRRLICYHLSES